MRILITGGAGFIGSHLAEACLERGDEIYIIDDLSTGSLDNLRPLMNKYQDSITFVKDTILNYSAMLELVGICDRVYHLAAAVGVQYIIDNPLNSILTNVRGTENVLELCAKFRKQIFLASTSEVYGKQSEAPLIETQDVVYGASSKSRWSYAAGKLVDEFTGLAYHKTKGLDVRIGRFFNTVGPKQTGRYGMVIPRFVRQALANEPITVYGDGEQRRTFTHVKEAVFCLLHIMDVSEAEGQVMNIGGVEEVSILQLAHRVKSLTDSSSEIRLIPYSEAFSDEFEDMPRRVPSTQKLRNLIGFAPTLGLNAILQDVIEYHRTLKETEEVSVSGAFVRPRNMPHTNLPLV